MQIPHVDTIRDLRPIIASGQGVPELRQAIQVILAQVGLMRGVEAEELPGEELMSSLAAREGLEGIRAADAPPTAAWSARLQARELALRSADALLRPLAEAAHTALHELTHLREEQLKVIRASEDTALKARIEGLLAEHHAVASQLPMIQQRLSMITPAVRVVEIYEDQLSRALDSTAPIREALCDAFAQSARTDLTKVLANLQLTEPRLESPPEELLEVLQGWRDRFEGLQAEVSAEMEQARTEERQHRAAIEDLLG